jgi:hypothetical protein
MKTAGDTITELSADPKYLNAAVGATSVLHTWGQNLSFHPHVHCIVPGGGISSNGLSFVSSRKKFFIPVKVLSSKFKGKFLFYFKNFFKQGKLDFFNDAIYLKDEKNFQDFIDTLYDIKWVVFCKKPFKTPFHVVNYLGRYTHRVAISDARIIEHDDDTVSFKYKDYKDKNRSKIMKLKKKEFLRRFLLHVLPSGFTKIRHYGLLASRNLKRALLKISKLCKQKPVSFKPKEIIKICPVCGHKTNLLFAPTQKIALESS